MSELRIRAATAGDFDAIAAITNHYIATTAIHFAYEPVIAADLATIWQSSIGRYPWLVAVAGDEVAAYAKAGEWRSRDAYRWTTELGLYVAPERRGAGIGRAIYAELLAACSALGFRSAIGGITLPNEASIALLVALGFVHVGTVRDAGWKHDAWHDVAFYQRRLAQTPPSGGGESVGGGSSSPGSGASGSPHSSP
jgi:L-amino acid N-acyltransferase YncA